VSARTGWLLAVLAWPAVLGAQDRSLAIRRFDAAITVQRDGAIAVEETITAHFTGSWNGIYRSIPVKYRTAQGLNWTLGLDVLGATDQHGRPLRVETEYEGRGPHAPPRVLTRPDGRDLEMILADVAALRRRAEQVAASVAMQVETIATLRVGEVADEPPIRPMMRASVAEASAAPPVALPDVETVSARVQAELILAPKSP